MSNNPFVVEQLTPQNSDGRPTGTYQLSKESVSPSRVIGRDARGYPIEDTIPTAGKWAYFLMADGCMNKVPLRSGSVPSQHADAIAYETETIHDMVMGKAIPGWLCPYSTQYTHLTRGPFVPVPVGEQDCGGVANEHGCKHLQAIAKLRKDEVLRIYNLDAERFKLEHKQEHERLRDGIIDGVGAAIAQHMAATPAAARDERVKKMQAEQKG
jgi:hypothetical protein